MEMKAPLLLAVCASLLAFGALGQAECPNPHDSNGDGAVTINDLLDLLGVFGDVDADLDGIWDSIDDCVDVEACNYAANPTEVCAYIDVLGECGGGCEGDGDGDGICDDVDTCVGDLDECGVCNGPGPTEIVIDEIVITYDSIYLPVDGEWFVYAVDVDTTFSYTCAPLCGEPVSYQGYDYATVLIGEQCWFAENLRSEDYENGDAIPSNLSVSEWSSTTSGAVSVYNEDASSIEVWGRLYNWYAVDDPRGLCPTGWHVPTDGDWMIMEMALGMSEAEANGVGWRGTDEGTQLKASPTDNHGWNGTNSSGFAGLPGGSRYFNGLFYNAGLTGYWWSSTLHGSIAISHGRALRSDFENVSRGTNNLLQGFSVRCVRD